MNITESFYEKHPIGNILPNEIIKNIYPKATASINDRMFCINAIAHYLKAMSKMEFKSDKLAIPELNHFELFFQIY